MKRGQMKLSFGMIFSIILIIVFISFAFYAIQKFLSISGSVKIGKFVDDLQSDVDKIWKGSQGSQEKEYFLPKKIGSVCFVDFSSPATEEQEELYSKLKQAYYGGENLIFYPVGSAGGLDSTNIKHLDIGNITMQENPFCIENAGGKVEMTIKKDYGEALVMITK